MLPPVVKNLLIINGLVFLAQITLEQVFQIDLVDYLGMHYFGSSKFNPGQLVTYMFLHGGFSHIFFNMFALWMFGYTLENVWGGKRFLTYYLVTGIGAALVHMFVLWIGISGMQADAAAVMQSPDPAAFTAFIDGNFPGFKSQLYDFISAWSQNPGSPEYVNQASKYMDDLINLKMDVPTVGASGAVFGILLAFGMMFPNSLIYLYFFFPIKAKWFVILYGAAEIYFGFANNQGDNVAHFAHLGGMIFGFFLIRYWNRKLHRYNNWD
ncbi:MAG: rhomboid family intramembrane serine protease [Lentimicrobiaceae bacterium]|nr:rhomboid family intramembrane serine protease [Lentimicrobiaceae bacterium]MCB9023375.1 rhomboid family intramembrane serine protease [Lentimicrobiaceae bacterium]